MSPFGVFASCAVPGCDDTNAVGFSGDSQWIGLVVLVAVAIIVVVVVRLRSRRR
jgi:hypothetical protein